MCDLCLRLLCEMRLQSSRSPNYEGIRLRRGETTWQLLEIA
jgi:hypothetical protein